MRVGLWNPVSTKLQSAQAITAPPAHHWHAAAAAAVAAAVSLPYLAACRWCTLIIAAFCLTFIAASAAAMRFLNFQRR